MILGMKSFQKQQLKRSKGIFLTTILFLISLESCFYSFVKGSLPFDKFVFGKFENKTYYLDFEERFYNKIFEIFPTYGNVKIVGSDERDTLSVTLEDYSKTPYEYGDDGMIKSYRYFLKSIYTVSKISENVFTEKIFSSSISEDECKDSLVVQNVKSFIDKVRKEF